MMPVVKCQVDQLLNIKSLAFGNTQNAATKTHQVAADISIFVIQAFILQTNH